MDKVIFRGDLDLLDTLLAVDLHEASSRSVVSSSLSSLMEVPGSQRRTRLLAPHLTTSVDANHLTGCTLRH